ncbi:hypothetical protein ACFL3Z_02665 [Gemmatimonadota bacterium]
MKVTFRRAPAGSVFSRTFIIPTATTDAIRALCDRGAKCVYAAASHALLSGPAVERLKDAPLEEMVVTNSIHVPEERRFEGLRILSVAGLLANAIQYIHSNESVSALFEVSDEDS